MKRDIILKSFKIDSFAGIDSSRPIILNLTEFHERKNIAIATGDMGAGKTSWINAILYSMAQAFGFNKENFINAKDKTIKIESEFEADGKKYKVNVTKSKFELLRLFRDGEDEKYIPENEPKTLLQKIVGAVGVNPMYLKGKSGKDQVKEFRAMFNVSPEVIKKEESIVKAFKGAEEARRNANREYERINKLLESSLMYQNWEESELKYSEEKNSTEASDKLHRAEIELSKLHNLENQIAHCRNAIAMNEQQMSELNKKIIDLKRILDASVVERDKLKNAEHDKDVALEEVLSIGNYMHNHQIWNNIKEQKSDMDKFSDAVIKLDAQKEDLRVELLKTSTSGIPSIYGLEVIAESTIDGLDEGVYYLGKSLAQISESELWELFLKIWSKNDVQFVFIENLSSLGSKAIDALNDLSRQGVKIFASQMDRSQKSLKISFTDKIE